jgi:hypothetical protein
MLGLGLARRVVAAWVDALRYLWRQKWSWILLLVLLAVVAVGALAFSVVSYFAVNQLLVPRMHREWSLVFEPPTPHNAVRSALVPLSELSFSTQYVFELAARVPENRVNLNGEKIVGLTMETSNGTVLWARRRSLLLRYKSWLRLTMERVMWAVPLVLGLTDEAQAVNAILCGDCVRSHEATVGRVELDATLQIYSATLTARAALTGLVYYWYNWRVTTMALFIVAAWSGQMFAVLCAVVVLLSRLNWFREVRNQPSVVARARVEEVASEEEGGGSIDDDDDTREASVELMPPASSNLALTRAELKLHRRKPKKKKHQ